MFIYTNEDSLLFLLRACEGARHRIVLTLWSLTKDLSYFLIRTSLQNALRRRVRVVVLGNPGIECPCDDFEKDGAIVLWCRTPIHSKLYAIDDLVISTDRNAENYYYQTIYGCHLSSDFVFHSSKIADEIERYVWHRGGISIDVSDGPYRLMIGFLRPFVDDLLERQRNLRILSGTYVPSLKMTRLLLKGRHEVIIGCPGWEAELTRLMERFLFTSRATLFIRRLFHYKIFVGSDFMIHGSYNMDFVSEILNQEHLVISTDPRDYEEMNLLYEVFKGEARQAKAIPLPFGHIIWGLTELCASPVFHFYSKFVVQNKKTL
jgi:phosphatidylserine/phosphatidylglycerophosphate/cardiolipin synthase-like enzyme